MSKEEKGKNEPIKGPLPNLVVSSDVDGDRPTLFDAFDALLADASLLPLLKQPIKNALFHYRMYKSNSISKKDLIRGEVELNGMNFE